MRKFEEVKLSIKEELEKSIQEQEHILNKCAYPHWKKERIQSVIDNYKAQLSELDETTCVEIGYQTNAVIDHLQKQYKLHMKEYYQNFESFLDNYVIVESYKRSEGCNGTYILGLGVTELSIFKGQDPSLPELCDELKQRVNMNFDTNIPMNGVEEQAAKIYAKALHSGDQETIDNAFVQLREVQRDSGSLKFMGNYKPLALDQEYQEAKNGYRYERLVMLPTAYSRKERERIRAKERELFNTKSDE